MKLLRRTELALFTLLLSIPVFSFGAVPPPQGGDRSGGSVIENPLKNDDLFGFVDSIIDAALKLGAVVAVIAIIIAGFMFVTAQGDEEKIKTAKKILLYAAIGILILFGARAISSVIVNTVKGVDEASQ